jgi:hypothetical protein
VKHLLQYLFTGAVLLMALIISSGQKNERTGKLRKNPGTEHWEVLAELSSNQLAGFTFPAFSRDPVLVNHSIPVQRSDHESVNSATSRVLFKIQLQIHLDHKLDLDFQSCRTFYHTPRSDDPPLS